MKKIKPEELKNMKDTKLGGSESIIYTVDDGKIYKEFLKNTKTKTLKNKERKIILLDHVEEVKDLYPKIHEFVYQDKILGYTMDNYEGRELDDVFLTYEEKKEVLKNIKLYIEKLKEYNIYYFDLIARNILISKDNEIKLVYMDNIWIEDYKCDLWPQALSRYRFNGGKNLDNALIYSLNYFSLPFLLGKSFLDIKMHMNIEEVCDNFENQEQKKLVKNLFNNKINTNCDHEYLIDLY